MKNKLVKLIISSILSICLLSSCSTKSNNKDPLEQTVNVSGVTLNKNDLSLYIGEKETLIATITPSAATNKDINWSSSDISVASINNGEVTALSTGSTIISVTSVDGNYSATCTVAVLEKVINVTSISLNKDALDLQVGDSETLIATITPNNATNKNVIWSSSNEQVATVTNGLINAIKEGTATIYAKSEDGNFIASCTINVINNKEKTIKGYIHDSKNLIKDNPSYSKSIDGTFLEVTSFDYEDEVKYYNFTYGDYIKFSLDDKDIDYLPLGLKVDDNTYYVDKNNEVIFKAEVEDIDDIANFFLSITVLYETKAPLDGDYAIDLEISEHLEAVFYAEDKISEIKGCDISTTIYIKVESLDEDYALREVKAGSITSDIGSLTYVTVHFDEESEMYYFKVPYAYNDIIKVIISEKNVSLFKDSPYVGEYITIRTYGFSSNNSYIQQFETNKNLEFDASGELNYYSTYSDKTILATSMVTEVNDGYAKLESGANIILGNNLIVFGINSSGNSYQTPFSNNSNDIGFAIKKIKNSSVNDYKLEAESFAIDGAIYASVIVKYQNKTYVSCFIKKSDNAFIYPDADFNLLNGTSLNDTQVVYEVIDADGTSLAHIGFVDEGGVKNRTLITNQTGSFKSTGQDILVFINDTQALFNGNIYAYQLNENILTLSIPTKEVTLTMDFDTYSFIINSIEDIEVKDYSFQNLTFKGRYYDEWWEQYNNIEIIFDNYTDQISGVIYDYQYSTYYLTFTGEIDYETNIMSITVVDEGYNKTSVNLGYKGKVVRLLIENGKLTFKDNIGFNIFTYKNVDVTCDDFVI